MKNENGPETRSSRDEAGAYKLFFASGRDLSPPERAKSALTARQRHGGN
jgi:hypothetical protein